MKATTPRSFGIATTAMAATTVVIFGLIGFRSLSVDLLPEITYPTLTIRTAYEGSAPAEVESLVTIPIEGAVSVVGGVIAVSSSSRAGLSEVIVRFDWGTNMDFAAIDVRESLETVRLPNGGGEPALLRFDPSLDPIMRLSLTGSDDLVALRQFAEETLKRREESLEGVASVVVSGGLQPEIVLVYLVMAAQFESLLQPLIILFAIPIGLAGVVFALYLTGTTINVVVLIGVVMMAGIVVNNAIVLVDLANRLRDGGTPARQAIREAGHIRLRPIVMTTATTIIGLLEIRDRIDAARSLLPKDMGNIRVRRFQLTDAPVITFSIARPGDPQELYEIAQNIVVPWLLRIDGVADVDLSGVRAQEITIAVNEELLAASGVTISQINRTLSANNVNLSAAPPPWPPRFTRPPPPTSSTSQVG